MPHRTSVVGAKLPFSERPFPLPSVMDPKPEVIDLVKSLCILFIGPCPVRSAHSVRQTLLGVDLEVVWPLRNLHPSDGTTLRTALTLRMLACHPSRRQGSPIRKASENGSAPQHPAIRPHVGESLDGLAGRACRDLDGARSSHSRTNALPILPSQEPVWRDPGAALGSAWIL